MKFGLQHNFEGKISEHSLDKSHKTISLCDVDGTIVKTSLVLDHACYLHDKNILNLGKLPTQWKKDMKNEALITELAESYRKSIKGKTANHIRVKEYLKGYTSNHDNFYSTLYLLNSLKKNYNSEVMLISGSPSFLVDGLAKKFGFKGVGSEYLKDNRNRFTGECVGMFSQDAKREFVSSMNLENYNNVYAFGDTNSDVALFEVANYSVLVDPHESTMNNIGHKVDEIIYE